LGGLSEQAQTLLEANLPLELPVEVPDVILPATERGYVISLGKKDWRRLHYLGGCSRVPGVHYLRFELLGEAQPPEDAYDDYCGQCWGTHGRAPPLAAAEEEEPGAGSPDTSEAEEE